VTEYVLSSDEFVRDDVCALMSYLSVERIYSYFIFFLLFICILCFFIVYALTAGILVKVLRPRARLNWQSSVSF